MGKKDLRKSSLRLLRGSMTVELPWPGPERQIRERGPVGLVAQPY